MLTQREAASGDDRSPRGQRLSAALVRGDGMIVTTTEGIGNVHDGHGSGAVPHRGQQWHAMRLLHARLRDERARVLSAEARCHRSGRSRISLAAISAAARATVRFSTPRERWPATTMPTNGLRTQKCLIDPSFPRQGQVRTGTDSHWTCFRRRASRRGRCIFRAAASSGIGRARSTEVHELKKQFVEQVGPRAGQARLWQHGVGHLSEGEAAIPDRHLRNRRVGSDRREESGIQVGATVPIQQLMDFVTEVIAAGRQSRRPACKPLSGTRVHCRLSGAQCAAAWRAISS